MLLRLRAPLAVAVGIALASACGPLACRRATRTDAPTEAARGATDGVMSSAEGQPRLLAKRGPVVGAKTADVSAMRMKLTLIVETGSVGAPKRETTELTSTESQKRVEETLAVEGDAPTRVKVTYAEKTDTVTSLGGAAEGGVAPAQKQSPLAGKTYVVEAKGGKLFVALESGAPAPAVEARDVALQYASLGRPDALLAAMPTVTPAAGEAIPKLSKALEEEISRSADGMTVGNGIVRFKEARGDVAVFDVSFTLWKDEGPMRFTMSLQGLMNVRADTSAIASMELRGPVAATARPGTSGAPKSATEVNVSGSGIMEIALSSTPL